MQIVVDLPEQYAPHLKKAVEFLSDHIGTRLEQGALLVKEHPLDAEKRQHQRAAAYIDAAIVCGALRKAVNAAELAPRAGVL